MFETILLFILLVACVLVYFTHDPNFESESKHDGLNDPPSPRSYPIIGHLHLLGGYDVPLQAFTDLGKKYGEVIRLKLGCVQSIIVNGQKNIREVLVTKGHHFDSRPSFERFQLLFCGNKENSLAFCDWSDLHKIRRDMLKVHMFPRAFTNKFDTLESLISSEAEVLISKIDASMKIKPQILEACANIFISHFCSRNFSTTDKKYQSVIENYDDVFYEVNQGYAADFLPFLMPLHHRHLKHIGSLAHEIRKFIVEHIVGDRLERIKEDDEPNDYVESLIKYFKFGNGPEISWDAALFALEDIIGGHSAVGNFLTKTLGFLVNEMDAQEIIQKEIDEVTRIGGGQKFRSVNILDRNSMPYTQGVIFEALRLIASPIVPRVANQDSSVNGFRIKKGAVIFLNNYDLNMSDELWEEPEKFMPERFIQNGHFVKPDHFLPFGGGRRSCLGYKMAQFVSFGILSALLQNFTIYPNEGETYRVPVGSLALRKDTFAFKFVRRSIAIV